MVKTSFFLNFVCFGRVPDPTSHFLPTSFLYVNLVAMGPVHLSPVTWPQALRYWYSLTPLMYIVTQLRPIDLHNFLSQIPESSQFLGASKLPLLEWTSPNAGSLTHTYSASIYPLTKACVSYLSAMILLFLDPQFKWAMLSPQGFRWQWVPFIARSIWAYVFPLSVLRPGSVQVENFFRPSGELNPHPWRWIKPTRDQHVKCNERQTRPCHRAY